MSKKQLIIVPGIRTKKEETWMTDLVVKLQDHSGIAANMDVHVFRYEYVNVLESISPFKRNKLRKEFQKYAAKISAAGPVSIIAHSFGTHIAVRSLLEGRKSWRLNNIELMILLGSILDWDLELGEVIARARKVVNFVSSKDKSVRYSPKPMFGRSGRKGFKHADGTYDMYSTIQGSGVYNTEDVLAEHMDYWRENKEFWMPFLREIILMELLNGAEPNPKVRSKDVSWGEPILRVLIRYMKVFDKK